MCELHVEGTKCVLNVWDVYWVGVNWSSDQRQARASCNTTRVGGATACGQGGQIVGGGTQIGVKLD